jgi:hypothetical protein|tara:strand:+ start:1678 stop:3855 length:2178 start_codon:yes stop_codon:yes gene_type:complete
MALTQIKFSPGIDKQDTSVGAQGRWVDSDNVRFRYGLPEKLGGWQSLLNQSIVGVSRKLHSFVDLEGNRYTAVGTDKFLLIYFEGQLFDITPVKTTITGVTMSTGSDPSKEVSLTFSANHNLISGDIILLDNVTVPSGVGLTDAAFENKLFQVTRVTSSLIAIITGTQNTSGAANGSCNITPYERVGPAEQSYGYGFGTGEYGGTVPDAIQNTLSSGINNSVTTIPVTSNANFPTVGTLAIGTELITYTGKGTNTFTGATRGSLGTTAATHSSGTVVTNATDYTGYGSAVEASTVTLEPGLWSLNNFGQVLVATIANGKTFTWNSGITARLATRASTTTSGFPTAIGTGVGNPTATRETLISPTTRHLIHFGTETIIGDPTSQDDMFIRFSQNENINIYDALATNTAGSQRIQDGTKIMGALVAKENILIWTDNSLYTMKFVGAPFTFGFEQVGTNCGLIGKNAAIEIDGVAYWMSNNGFFSFDGTVNSLPCSVEDYVFDDAATTKGQQICAGINNLFTEVTWWYPSSGSDFNNRYVTYNYGQTSQATPMGNWYTGTNTNSIRTAWIDSLIYPRPYATAYLSSNDGTFPEVIGQDGLGQTLFFEHEVGTDQINPDGSTTTLTSFVNSYNFSLQPDSSEVFLAMRRFLPNFKVLTGDAQVTISLTDYPSTQNVSSALSPFIINASTTKVDTRARGRYANIKIANTGAGQSWRFGTFQVDLQPDGRR